MDRRTFLAGTGALWLDFSWNRSQPCRDELAAHVAWLRDLPRPEAVERAAQELRAGLSAETLLHAVFVAAAIDIRPDVASFNHVVLVAQSIHALAGLAPASARVPLLWCVDYFKAAQAEDARRGDWVLRPVRLPDWSAERSRRNLLAALDGWDPEAADVAMAALCQTAGGAAAFAAAVPFGLRCQANIGHKGIFTAAAAQVLPRLGWRHAADVLRPLVASWFFGGRGERSAAFAASQVLAREVAAGTRVSARMIDPVVDPSAPLALAAALREGTPDEAARAAAAALKAGAAPGAVWDELVTHAAELVLAARNVVSLHALTSTEALHALHAGAEDPEFRHLTLLQCAAWQVWFRRSLKPGAAAAASHPAPEAAADGASAAASAVGGVRLPWILAGGRGAPERMRNLAADAATQDTLGRELATWVASRADDVHEFKGGVAVLRELPRVSPPVRPLLLAAATVHLPAADRPRTAQALHLAELAAESLR